MNKKWPREKERDGARKGERRKRKGDGREESPSVEVCKLAELL